MEKLKLQHFIILYLVYIIYLQLIKNRLHNIFIAAQDEARGAPPIVPSVYVYPALPVKV